MSPRLRRHLAILLIALLSLAGVYAFVRRQQIADAQRAMASDLPELEWLRREFEIPADRFEKIRVLHLSFDRTCHQMCRELAEAQDNLHRTVTEHTTMTPDVQAAMQRTAMLRERCRQATLGHMYEISAFMTPEQATRYREEISRRVVIKGRLPHLDEYGSFKSGTFLEPHKAKSSAEPTPASHD